MTKRAASQNVNRLSRRRLFRLASLGLLGASAAEVFASTYDLSVEEKTLHLPRWDADGFRAAVLADLHVDSDADASLTQRAIAAALEAKPDVILFLGDYVSAGPGQSYDRLSLALQSLAWARCPCYGILGNHDGSGGSRKLVELLRDNRIAVLRDSAAEVQGVSLLGFADAIADYPNYGAFRETDYSRSSIVMLHEPDMVSFSPSWASVQLSGHSHGGQICLPFGIPLLRIFGAQRYVVGFYEDAPLPLYVSRGIGTRRIPVRLFCRPEVSLITFRS